MSAPHAALDRLLTPSPRIRIAHPWGHGLWQPAEKRAALDSWVVAMNAKFGAGTHRIEQES